MEQEAKNGRPCRRPSSADAEPLPTIWTIPDVLWQRIDPVVQALDPPKATGRKRADARGVLNVLIYRLRSGCQ